MIYDPVTVNTMVDLIVYAQVAGELLEINRNTITVWKRDAEFVSALDARIKEIWKDSEMLAVNAMRNLALQGNFNANKYILDSLGYAPKQQVEMDLHTDINIVVEE